MTMGWAQRANDVATRRARRRIEDLKVRVRLGTLTHADVQLLNTLGPNVRRYVEYEPMVQTYAPKVTLR